MAQSFIGKPISLVSHSDVRYRGILAGIDPVASTIQLSNVYSMGTESRRPPVEYIPPVAEPYQYIIFKAAEVKDLAVDEPVVPRRNVHDDPAVMASAPLASNNYAPYAPPAPVGMGQPPNQPPPDYSYRPQPPQAAQPPVAQQQSQAAAPPQQQQPPAPPTAAQVVAGSVVSDAPPRAPQQQQIRRPNAVQTAAASLETVERALGDLRVSNGTTVTAAAVVNTTHHAGGGRGGRRGGGHRGGGRGGEANGAEIKVPTTDFDFESMNAKFDKAALAAAAGSAGPAPKDAGPLTAAAADASGATVGAGDQTNGKEKGPAAYNPQKSFFDTLSSNTAPEPSARGGGRGRGRGGPGGRNRREEEREKNVATFGEPGGVGLMGPGAYVGGWGGYGRRGGRGRGRGGRGGHGHHNAAPREAQQAVPARG